MVPFPRTESMQLELIPFSVLVRGARACLSSRTARRELGSSCNPCAEAWRLSVEAFRAVGYEFWKTLCLEHGITQVRDE